MAPPELSTRLEFSLEDRERLLREAERLARMGSFAWHVPTGTVHWSDELFRILGVDPAQHAPSSERFFGAIHPDDVAGVHAVAARGVATGVADSHEFRVVRPDGSVRHVQMNGAALLDESGAPSRFVGTIFDVTDRVEAALAQRRRELVLLQAQRVARVGSFEWSPSSGEMSWSDELRRICGGDARERVDLAALRARVHDDDRDAFDAFCARAARGSSKPLECRFVADDGETRDVRIHVGALHDERASTLDVLGTVHDVTELRVLEGQLLQSQKMDALGRLAGGIAHDFNNLLTVLGLHVARLRSSAHHPSVDSIATAIEHASALTLQLLAFSRQTPLAMRDVELVELVAESVKLVEPLFERVVSLVVEIGRGPHVTRGDRSQLAQVLMNLLLNARDAMPTGGTVTVRVDRVQYPKGAAIGGAELPPGDYVTLAVRDDGVGMTDEVRRRLFEPFVTTKTIGRGTGLGMAMVLGTVSQLGGAVDVASEPGRGATVTVLLPATTTDTPRESDDAPDASKDRAPRLLLIEDEAPLREILAEVLHDAGFEVCAARDGKAALEALDGPARDVHMVISDVRMPGLSGPEVVARIRLKLPGIRVLFISGHAPATSALGLDDPRTRFLPKPFTPTALLDVVHEALAQGRGG